MRKPLLTLGLALAAAALACSFAGQGATPAPGGLETSAAATLTGLAPAATGGPASTATPGEAATALPPATDTTAPPAPSDTPLAPTEGPAAAACSLVYASTDPQSLTGSLNCLGPDDAPHLLVDGVRLAYPQLSPDGQWVAYRVAVSDVQSELWVVGADGSGARKLVGAEQVPNADPTLVNSPNRFQWVPGTHAIIFDTRFLPVGGATGPGEYANADLWRLDADSGALTPLLPAGSGGLFAVSPDGTFVAVSRPTGLDLVNSDGSNYRPDRLNFPTIITYSEYFYKPDAVWSPDSTFFSVAIPSADPLAPDPSIAFYRVGADGIVAPLSTLPGNFVFGGRTRPQFSPDGQWVAYSLYVESAGADELHLARADGQGTPGAVAPVMQVAPQGWGWAPDSQHFAYTAIPGPDPGQGFVVATVLDSVQTFADGLTAISTLRWRDAATLVFAGKINAGGWALYQSTPGGTPTLLADGLGDFAEVDVGE